MINIEIKDGDKLISHIITPSTKNGAVIARNITSQMCDLLVIEKEYSLRNKKRSDKT